MANEDDIWRVTFECNATYSQDIDAAIELVANIRGEFPPTLSFFEQEDKAGWTTNDAWLFEIFFNGEPDESYITAIKKITDIAITIEQLEDRDWVSESQKLLTPVTAGRIFIYGSHDADLKRDFGINLLIEAGQAFGTGQHETTCGCLLTLDSLMDELKPNNVLDLGTGSGVLAMAAYSAWLCPTLATDIDPIATTVTRENIAINNLPAREVGTMTAGIATATADGLDDEAFIAEGPFDVIFANILARPLIEMAADISNALASGGHLILAGLLDSQEKEVLESYCNQGLVKLGRNSQGEWPALLMRKP